MGKVVFFGKGITGRAPFGENVAYFSQHILDRKEATEGTFKDTGKTDKGLATLERTGPHEVGHSANLEHPDIGTEDGNIMHQTRRSNAGKKLTEKHILQIEKIIKTRN